MTTSSRNNTALPLVDDCWNRIGVHGNRSCPELIPQIHCHNCPVFSQAGRRFLDAPTPEGYLDEWTNRLAQLPQAWAGDHLDVLIFRLAEEWLALPLATLVEVTTLRNIHRVPHRGGVLAGMVSVRGELFLCAVLAKALGLEKPSSPKETGQNRLGRMLVIRRENERWVIPVDTVEQVSRIPKQELKTPPATLARAIAHLVSGVFAWNDRAVGLIDDARLFDDLRAKLR